MNYHLARVYRDAVALQNAWDAVDAARKRSLQFKNALDASLSQLAEKIKHDLHSWGQPTYKLEVHTPPLADNKTADERLFYVWMQRKDEHPNRAIDMTGGDFTALTAVRRSLQEAGFKQEDCQINDTAVIQFFSIDTNEGKYE